MSIKKLSGSSIGELLEGIKIGNQSAFEQLYYRFYKWLLAVSLAIARNKEVAEEIVEDVFFELWNKRRECDQIKSIESFLYVTVKNRTLDYYRKSSKNHFVEIEELNNLEVKISPEDIYLFEELSGRIDMAVSDLPPKCAEIFRLIKFEGLSHKETAKKLGISPKTVENQLGIAVKKMALMLESYLKDNPYQNQKTLKVIIFLCMLISV
ncbi:RNA polymerase sigma-70 factor [Reichenbachiella sp. MALMAid0571]|uniref:RNA polymerase sigma factor n=1 Tax=Reichenbachiella sp. MALMAid0571 TaxID=3143939 RepID=UPI0032DF4F90